MNKFCKTRFGDRDASVVGAVRTAGARRGLKKSTESGEYHKTKMIVSLEKIEGDLEQSSVVILSFLIGIKIVQFSASIEHCHGIESVNFDRDLWQVLTYVSGNVEGTKDFIRAVIAFHNGKTIALPITLGNLEPTPAEPIIFADYN
jgi:hypothetical protein